MTSESTMELLFDQQPRRDPSLTNILYKAKKRNPSSISGKQTQEREMKLLVNCVLVAISMILSCLVQESSAQDNACLQQLLPCMDYLNGTRDPPRSCCDPLKYVINSEPECLCQMLSVKGANQAERSGINLTDAQQLPGKCGEHINPLGCILGSPSSYAASFSCRYPSVILTAASLMIVPFLWTFLNTF